MKDFEGKVVLITGGRSGIGLACAEAFNARGATVVTAQRGEDDKHEHIIEDLADPDAPARIIADVLRRHKRLDVLVNNAGFMREGTIVETTLQEWIATLQVNLTAPFLMARYALRSLIETQGSIINIGSIEGLASNPRHPAYAASKGGLHALTRAIAVDHGAEGVRCNAVAPGWIDTDLNEAFIESLGEPEMVRTKLKTLHPVGRTGTPKDVADLVCWLASDEAGFVTGQIWTVDGGRMSKLSLP